MLIFRFPGKCRYPVAMRGRRTLQLGFACKEKDPLEAFQGSFVAVVAVFISPWSLG